MTISIPAQQISNPEIAKHVSRALSATHLCDRALFGKDGAHAEAEVMCFFGPIERNRSATQLLAHPIPQGGIIVLRSGGGEVTEAMMMAEALLPKQITVVVAGDPFHPAQITCSLLARPRLY